METVAELNQMLEDADAAGDTEAVEFFVNRIRLLQKPKSVPMKTPLQAAAEGAERGLASGTQGLTLGFSDEIMAALNAAGGSIGAGAANVASTMTGRPQIDRPSVADRYVMTRDALRKGVEEETQKNPILAAASRIAGAAPFMAAKLPAAVTAAASRIAGPAPAAVRGVLDAVQARPVLAATLAGAGRAGGTGLATGTLAGLGESEADTVGDMALDALKTGTFSAATGAAFPIVGGVARGVAPGAVGAVGAQIRTRAGGKALRESEAQDYAREKIAQALMRDQPGRKTTEEMIRRGEAVGSALGPDARLVDVGGKQTRRLLDTVATQPGSTAEAVAQVQRARKFNQFSDITAPAEKLLLGRKSNYSTDLREAAEARQVAAGPLYKALEGVEFEVDDGLETLLKRAKSMTGKATKRSEIRGEFENLKKLKVGDKISLNSLNVLKSTLHDSAVKEKIAGEGGTAKDIHGLRIALKAKIDELSPKDSYGNSLARQADEVWSGLESYKTSIEAGRNAMKSDAITLADDMAGLSQSEREGFMIGAVQSIKDMAGTEAGRTRLLNMWHDKTVGNKLRELYGDDFAKLQKSLAGTERRKRISSVGTGSQTYERLAGAEDLDVSAVANDLRTGQPTGILTRMIAGMKTPEAVRDQIGKILLSDPAAIRGIEESARRVEAARLARAAASGRFTGILPLLQ